MSGEKGQYEGAENFPIAVTHKKGRLVIRHTLCNQVGVFIKTAADVLEFMDTHICNGGHQWRNENTGTG